MIAAIVRFRAGGYDEALGFTVYDTLRYRDALRPLVEKEVEVLVERLGDVEPERAAEIVRAGREPAARPDRRDALEDAARGAAPGHQRTRWRSMTPQPERSSPASGSEPANSPNGCS